MTSLAVWSRERRILAIALILAGGIAAFVYLRPARHDADGRSDRTAGESAGGFQECAKAAGITFHMDFLPNEQGEKFKINLYDHGCGVAVGDFNGDGFDDIYFVNQFGRNALYRNNCDGTFTDVTDEAGVGLGDRVCVAAAWADYDNDGLLDLFVTSTRGGNVLFKNLGNGKFKDVTKEAGLTCFAHSQTAVFFDYDNDGYLDLLVTNTAEWTNGEQDPSLRYYPGLSGLAGMATSPKEHNRLYHNNRDGTFTDVTAQAGLLGLGWSGDVSVFDYDEDGFPDVLITNMFGRSQLYRNNGNGTFTDVTRRTLGRTSWGAIGSKAFDFDNDGRMDLLIVDMHSDMWMPLEALDLMWPFITKNAGKKFPDVSGGQSVFNTAIADRSRKRMEDVLQINKDEVVFGNTLFRNLGGGKFEEVSDKAGIETFWPWGIATGDFDNDGNEDVFLPSGMGFPFPYWPNALMMNNGDGTFSDRARTCGVEPPTGGEYLSLRIAGQRVARSSRCAAVADFTNSGRLDIITNNFNDTPYFFRNTFSRKNYISFRLKGTTSNRDAIGARTRLYVDGRIMVRQVQAAGGYLSQSSNVLHFGLGDHAHVDRVEIKWPSGAVQIMNTPSINSLHTVVEGASLGSIGHTE